MYVQVCRQDRTMIERPAVLRWEGGTPYAYWSADRDGRGVMIVTAARVFADNGNPVSAFVVLDPPYAIQAEEQSYDDWTFRIPVEIPCPVR